LRRKTGDQAIKITTNRGKKQEISVTVRITRRKKLHYELKNRYQHQYRYFIKNVGNTNVRK